MQTQPMSPKPAELESSSPTAITDTRIIDFTLIAIRAAIEGVGVTILGLPVGLRVKTIGLRPQSRTVHLDYGTEGPQRTLVEGEIAAMLIAYCIAAQIPMPRKAEKRLRVTETSIAFGFVTTRRLPPWVIPTSSRPQMAS